MHNPLLLPSNCVMEIGRQLGIGAVSSQIFTSMIIVVTITCTTSALLLRPLLQKTIS